MRHLLLTLLLFNGISALAGGALLMAAPDGSLLRMPLSQLEHSPFSDLFLPGMILFAVLGVGSCAGAVLVKRRAAVAVRWVRAEGAATMIWIVTQVLMIQGFHHLQAAYAALGLALVLLAPHGTQGSTR